MTLEKIILKRPTQTTAHPKRLTLHPGQSMSITIVLLNFLSYQEIYLSEYVY